MEIKKKSGSYNAYNAELSWGQLEAIKIALEKDHADPLSDELFQGMVWYMNGNLPVPGEDPKEKKKADDNEGDDLLDVPSEDDGAPTIRRGRSNGASPDREEKADDSKADDSEADDSEADDSEAYMGPGESDADADNLLPEPPEE